MSREQALQRGAVLMVLGALIFFVYAVVFFFRALSAISRSSAFEDGGCRFRGFLGAFVPDIRRRGTNARSVKRFIDQPSGHC